MTGKPSWHIAVSYILSKKNNFFGYLKLNLVRSRMFIYKDKAFQQIDEVAVGPPLCPTMANFFLADLET